MVKQLFGTPGAAQDETVFKFANDVSVDQTTEIARMERMLRLDARRRARFLNTFRGHRMTRVRFLPLLPAAAVALLLGCAGSTSSGNGTPVARERQVGAGAEPRPARRSQGRTARRRRSGVEPAGGLREPRPRAVRRDHQLRPGLHRQLSSSRATTTASRCGTSRIRPKPTLVTGVRLPRSQSDVSVYKNLLFVSGEDLAARLDCGTQGVQDTVSTDRLRGLRIFDISDIHQSEERRQRADLPRLAHPHGAGGSQGHRRTSTSTSRAPRRCAPPSELPGCIGAMPNGIPTRRCSGSKSSRCRWRTRSRRPIVSSPRIFDDLVAPPTHGDAPEDSLADGEGAGRGQGAGRLHRALSYGEEQVLDR